MKHLNILFALMILTASYTIAQKPQLLITDVQTNVTGSSDKSLTTFTYNFMDYYGAKYATVDQNKTNSLIDSAMIADKSCNDECVRSICKSHHIEYALIVKVKEMAGSIYVSAQMLNSDQDNVDKIARMEFLDYPDKIEFMVKLTLQQLLEIPQEQNLLNSLTNETMLNNSHLPNYNETLNLSGPRLGYTAFVGPSAKILTASKSIGGFDFSSPGLFNIGYQFEQQYLQGGHLQGLIEFIPQIGGLDQGLFLPSLTIVNGLRDSRSGFEFGFGPTFTTSRTTQKYLDLDGNWYRPMDKANTGNIPLEEKLDSRGTPTVKANLLFAVGKSFKAGTINIPVNLFFVPNKNDYRFGISAGYNFFRN